MATVASVGGALFIALWQEIGPDIYTIAENIKLILKLQKVIV